MSGREWGVLAVAAACAVGAMGWIVWSEMPRPPAETADRPAPATTLGAGPAPETVEVDAARIAQLEAEVAAAAPDDAAPRAALGDLYFEARQFDEAITWYEQAVALDPDNPDTGTSLGVSYFFADQSERAAAAIETVLAASPGHPRALLSLGIVRAYGLQDLEGARAAWEQVLAAAPDAPESVAAREAMDRLMSVHDGAAAP